MWIYLHVLYNDTANSSGSLTWHGWLMSGKWNGKYFNDYHALTGSTVSMYCWMDWLRTISSTSVWLDRYHDYFRTDQLLNMRLITVEYTIYSFAIVAKRLYTDVEPYLRRTEHTGSQIVNLCVQWTTFYPICWCNCYYSTELSVKEHDKSFPINATFDTKNILRCS